MTLTFDYGVTRVRDLQVTQTTRKPSGKLSVDRMEVGGRVVQPTARFWKSFFFRFCISDNVFRYFQPEEVFERISQMAPQDELRYCLERSPDGQSKDRLLAVTNPGRPVIRYGEVAHIVDRYAGRDVSYHEGLITSNHTPRSGTQPFSIHGDQFHHRFTLETPIDGFGHPKIFLSLLRMICANGMVGYTRAFRSDISLGNDIAQCITRAIESFDNDEGYAAFRQRIENAQQSWASVRECGELRKALIKVSDGRRIQADHWQADFHRMTGNLNTLYGLANLDAISPKRQRVLPARCRVYDLLNFASEVATHRADPIARKLLHAYSGRVIADEYDLEGTAETVTDFADFFVQDDGPGPQASVN